MAERAAIVTGGSSGIGLAIARMLAEEGYALTVAARRPEKLTEAADGLRADGYDVQEVAGNLSDEDVIKSVVETHKERFGRLDVLVNNAGVGVAAAAGDHETKRIHLQLSVNLRAIVLFYRESLELLRAAGAEHRSALVVNTSSISGKSGQPWLSVYSATKAGVVGYTQAINKELNGGRHQERRAVPRLRGDPDDGVRAGARSRDRLPASRGGVVTLGTNSRKEPSSTPFRGSVHLHILGRRPCREPHHWRGHRRQPPGAPGAD